MIEQSTRINPLKDIYTRFDGCPLVSKETQSSSEVQVMLFARNGDEICLSSGKDTPHRPASFVRQIIQGRDYPIWTICHEYR